MAETRFKKCIECGDTDFPPEARYCMECGTPLFNACTNQECQKANPDKAKYCMYCGSETVIGAHECSGVKGYF